MPAIFFILDLRFAFLEFSALALHNSEYLLDAVVVELDEGAFFGRHVSHLALVVGPLGAVAEHNFFVRARIEEWPCLDELFLVQSLLNGFVQGGGHLGCWMVYVVQFQKSQHQQFPMDRRFAIDVEL